MRSLKSNDKFKILIFTFYVSNSGIYCKAMDNGIGRMPLEVDTASYYCQKLLSDYFDNERFFYLYHNNLPAARVIRRYLQTVIQEAIRLREPHTIAGNFPELDKALENVHNNPQLYSSIFDKPLGDSFDWQHDWESAWAQVRAEIHGLPKQNGHAVLQK